MERIARFMEIFWLVLTLATGGWALYILYMHGWEVGKVWLLFPAVCAAMFGYRRFMRGRMERWARQQRTEEESHGR